MFVDRLMERFMRTGQFEEGELNYQQVNKWSQTLPYSCIYLTITALMMSCSIGRRLYASMVLGGFVGVVWMRFH